jgi:hypothetical protein
VSLHVCCKRRIPNMHCSCSVKNVSTAVAGRRCSAKTSGLGESACPVALPNTSPSEPTLLRRRGGGSFLTRDWPLCPPALSINYTKSAISRTWKRRSVWENPWPVFSYSHRSVPSIAEPLACAIHGVDVIQPKVGSEGERIYVSKAPR